MFDKIITIGRRLGRPDILFWTLPWLMILIFFGTIAQKNIGLYEAQKQFFSSFFFFWQGIPLPGGYLTLSIMTLNLSCKFIFNSIWSVQKIGSHIAHLSIIILFFGGLLTAVTMTEGFIDLKEGEKSNIIRDYNKRILTLNKGNETIRIPFLDIQNYDFSSLPFDIEIITKCENSKIIPRPDLESEKNDGVGAAKMVTLECAPKNIENEQNIAGLIYQISNAPESENGTYIIFEGRQTFDDIKGYTVTLGREVRPLPFTVQLNNFEREVYPGTNMPKEYESRVTIFDGDVVWPAIISMNEPLRYKGYTLYQASTLIDSDGQPVSVLSVVVNKGWIFPYISGILLALGLCVHLVIRVRTL